MSRAKIIIISVTLSVLLLLGVTVGVYFFWPWNKEFFSNADEEFSIPGLDTEFCPQGMTELVGYNRYIISGYMDDGSPSRFYVIDSETNEVEKYFILNIDGKLYDGHAGGVASYQNTLWTVSKVEDEGYAFRFMASDVMNVQDGGEVIVRDYFQTLNNADFVFVNNDILWVGEFYKEGDYDTDTNHHITTRSGETNKAMAYGFDIDEGYRYGLDDDSPDMALSIRDLCQGIEVTSDGKFVVSTSYSIPNSNIYYYKDVLNEEKHDTYRVGLYEVPLWYLDNEALLDSFEMPAMSEEMFIKNNRVYVLFESACKKYKLYNRVRLDSVYSFPLSYFEE